MIYKYWGKVNEDNQCHLLPYHCLDVIAVADCWWKQDLALQQTFLRAVKIEPKRFHAWLLFFIGLHDLGKFDVRFQLKVKDIALKLQPLFTKAKQSSSHNFYHGIWGYAWFLKEFENYGFDSYSHEHELEWMQCVASHHGGWVDVESLPTNFANSSILQYDAQARQQWVAALRELFLAPVGIQVCDEPPKLSKSVQRLLVKFCSVSDWVGSNRDNFPYESDNNKTLADYLQSRRSCAKLAIYGH